MGIETCRNATSGDHMARMPAAVKLSICAIASEVVPLAKSGGLADVASALSRQLTAQRPRRTPVRAVLPRRSRATASTPPASSRCRACRIVTGSHEYRGRHLARAAARLGDARYTWSSPTRCTRGPRLYTSDPDEHRRFLVLTRAALECCRRMNFRPHIVHSHDWHTAFAPLWLRSNYKSDPVFAGTRR